MTNKQKIINTNIGKISKILLHIILMFIFYFCVCYFLNSIPICINVINYSSIFMCFNLFLFESFYSIISYVICTFFIFIFILTMFILSWLLSWKGTIQSTYSFHVYFCIHYFLYLFGSCLFQYTFGIIDYSFTFIYSYLFLFEFFFTIILYFIILFQWAPPMIHR